MNKTKTVLSGIFLSTSLLLAACAPSNEDTGSESSQETGQEASGDQSSIIIANESVTPALDPAVEWDGWATVRYGISETLFRFNEEMEVEPWLAESYENIDPNTWKITLKEGIQFSNGEALTPDIVVQNLEHIAETNDRAAYLLDASYEVDGQDITITTTEPIGDFIYQLGDPYASMIDLNNTEDAATQPIGTGPYQVAEFEPETNIRLVPNENYWNGDPQLAQATFTAVEDQETKNLALQNGDVDAGMNMTIEGFQTFEGNEDYNNYSIPTGRAFMMYYNLDTLEDQRIREGIHLLIDKESLANDLLDGSMTPAEGFFPDYTGIGGDQLEVETYNIERAEELFEEAGLVDSDNDGYRDLNGEEFAIRIAYYERLALEPIAVELQAALDRAGIQSEVQKYESTDYFESNDYDLGFYSVVTNSIGDPYYFLNSVVSPDGVQNYTNYSSEAALSLVESLENEFDPEERAKLAIQIQQEIINDRALEVFGFNNSMVTTKASLEGFEPHPSDYYGLTVDTRVVE